MIESKEYRKDFGFTNKGNFVKYLKAKDIVMPNWSLIEKRDERIVSVFSHIQKKLLVQSGLDIQSIVEYTRDTIRNNNILYSLNNHGRAIEDVYHTWMQGYIAELVFTPLIESLLSVKDIARNGGDDLTDPSMFKRKADADLRSDKGRYLIDVQAGFGDTKGYDIKYHKVKEALSKKDWKSYVFFADCVNGQYHLQNLNALDEAVFLPNPRWEGQLCHTISNKAFKSFLGD